MDWNNVTVNPLAAGLIGVAWQHARGTSVPNWLSGVAAVLVTVVAYVATVRPEIPTVWIGWFDLAMHLLVWLGLAFGLGRAAKSVKVGSVQLAPKTKL